MRFIAFALLVVAATSVEARRKICEPGSYKKADCNSCVCSKDGTAWGCTLMLCSDEDLTQVRPRREAVEQVCEPGEEMNDGCNTCFCLGDGSGYVCTMKSCPENNPLLRIAPAGSVQVCEPGEQTNDGCNTCFCLGDGSGYVCTLKACIEDNSLLRSAPAGSVQVCEPGEEMNDGCNTCYCLGDGSGYVCTMKSCLEHNPLLRSSATESGEDCKPGEFKKMQCNDCFCANNGIGWACTAKACPEYFNEDGSLKLPNEIANHPFLRESHETEDNDEKECEPGKSFKKYCNSCFCGPNGKPAGCTKMACPPGMFNEDGSFKRPHSDNPLLREKRETNDNCEPGKRFRKFCNTCACGPDGKKSNSACTRMSCVPGMFNEDGSFKRPHSDNPLLREKRETNDNCEPGKRFRKFCNTCACGPDGKKSNSACTRMSCVPGMFNEDGSFKRPHSDNPLLREKRETNDNCEPGKRFRKFCNTCACGPDGKKSNSACTRMSCVPGMFNEDGSFKRPHSDNPLLREKRETNDNCEPGKRFRLYCNSCVCGPEGKKSQSACTEMACPPGVFNEDGSLRLPYSDNPLLREKRETNDNCEPGKRFQHYCNSCACGPTGKKVDAPCTRMYCTPGMYNEDGSLRSPNDNPLLRRNSNEKCEPGKRFQHYCNSCTCGPSGKKSEAACTKMYCPPGFFNEDGSRTTLVHKSDNGGDNSAPKICEPGKSFKDDCNTCVCNKDGTSAICTLVFCFPKALTVAKSALGGKLPQVCEPGKSFFEDCNQCVCSEDGTSARCTLMNCSTKDEDRQKRSVGIVEPSNQFCSPGETFKEDCNRCVCGADGTNAFCTLQFCASRYAKSERSAKQFCEPGKSYKQDCNSCVCNEDGTSAACTLKMCLPSFLRSEKTEQQVCQPGKSFKKDCNDCICNKFGTGAVCTLQLCPPVLERTERSAPQICQPGKSFKQDCNDCVCSKDGTSAACTLKLCPSSLERTKRSSEPTVCQPGKSFKQDCNSCICNKDGTGAACTLQLCLTSLERTKRSSEPRVCQPGTTFKQDCNYCICSKDGTRAACTLQLCPPSLERTKRSNAPRVCQPGKIFKDDCNDCICNKDGTGAACTLQLCPPALERTKRSSSKPTVCQPGKSFKDDCNDCICNKDGTDAICTLKLCPSEFEREVETTAKQICEPGKTFKRECNTCTCNKSGTGAACSLEYCLTRPGTTKRSVAKVCEPGKFFKKGCNSCICNKYGTDAACTLLVCTDEDILESLP